MREGMEHNIRTCTCTYMYIHEHNFTFCTAFATISQIMNKLDN